MIRHSTPFHATSSGAKRREGEVEVAELLAALLHVLCGSVSKCPERSGDGRNMKKL